MRRLLYLALCASFFSISNNLLGQDLSCLDYYNFCESYPKLKLNNACEVYPDGSTGFNLTGSGITVGIYEPGTFSHFCLDCIDVMGFFKGEGYRFLDCNGDFRILTNQVPGCPKPHPNYSYGLPNPNNIVDCDEMFPGGTAFCDWAGTTLTFDINEPSWSDKHYEIVGKHIGGFGENYLTGEIYQSGVAPLSLLKFYDSNNIDELECELENGEMLVSNHSYQSGCKVYGNNIFENYDETLVKYPFHLACGAAGNKQGVTGGCTYMSGATNPINGKKYFNTSGMGNYKNTLSVGALTANEEVTFPIYYGQQAHGPSIDGRIKPDVLAFSVNSGATATTSFATPIVTGTASLLYEHWINLYGTNPLATTIKATIIHNANPCHYDFNSPSIPFGPNYSCGWGVVDIEKSATHIAQNQSEKNIFEETLANGEVHYYRFIYDGSSPIKISTVWADAPSSKTFIEDIDPIIVTPSLLINDLDIKLGSLCKEEDYYPWTLNPNMSSGLDFLIAKRDKPNNLDNVEQVYLFEEEISYQEYILEVSHKGILQAYDDVNGVYVQLSGQPYSLLVSGGTLEKLENYDPNQFVAQVDAPQTYYCDSNTDGIELIGADNGIISNGAVFSWDPLIDGEIINENTLTPTVYPGQTTIYTLTVVNPENGCITSDEITIFVDDINISFGEVFDCNSTTAIIPPNPITGNNFLWSTGETTSTITVNSSGIYTVNYLDEDGCAVSANVSAILQDAANEIFGIPEDIFYCNQNNQLFFHINPLVSSFPPISQWQWSDQNIVCDDNGYCFIYNTGGQAQGTYSVDIEIDGCVFQQEISFVDGANTGECQCLGFADIADSELTIEKGQQEVWNAADNNNSTSSLEVKEMVHVYGRLIIENIEVRFDEGAGIIVHPGAYLTVKDNALLTACDEQWEGIKVFAIKNHWQEHDFISQEEFDILCPNGSSDPSFAQTTLNGIPLTINHDSIDLGNLDVCELIEHGIGLFDMYNGASIEKAVAGVTAKYEDLAEPIILEILCDTIITIDSVFSHTEEVLTLKNDNNLTAIGENWEFAYSITPFFGSDCVPIPTDSIEINTGVYFSTDCFWDDEWPFFEQIAFSDINQLLSGSTFFSTIGDCYFKVGDTYYDDPSYFPFWNTSTYIEPNSLVTPTDTTIIIGSIPVYIPQDTLEIKLSCEESPGFYVDQDEYCVYEVESVQLFYYNLYSTELQDIYIEISDTIIECDTVYTDQYLGGMIRIGAQPFVPDPNYNPAQRQQFDKNDIDIDIDYTNYYSCCGINGTYAKHITPIQSTDFYRWNPQEYGLNINSAYRVRIEDCLIRDGQDLTNSALTENNGIYIFDTQYDITNNAFESLNNALYSFRLWDGIYAGNLVYSDNLQGPISITDNEFFRCAKGAYVSNGREGAIIAHNYFYITKTGDGYNLPNDPINTSGTEDVIVDIYGGGGLQENVLFGLHLVNSYGTTVENNEFTTSGIPSPSQTFFGLITTSKGGELAQNIQPQPNYILCNAFGRTSVGYQSQHGDDQVEVRNNNFAYQDSYSPHKFGAWVVLDGPYGLGNQCEEDSTNLTWNKWSHTNAPAGNSPYWQLYIAEDVDNASSFSYFHSNGNDEYEPVQYTTFSNAIGGVSTCFELSVVNSPNICALAVSNKSCADLLVEIESASQQVADLEKEIEDFYFPGIKPTPFYPCIATPWNNPLQGNVPDKPDLPIKPTISIGGGNGNGPSKPGGKGKAATIAENAGTVKATKGKVKPTGKPQALLELERQLQALEAYLAGLMEEYRACMEDEGGIKPADGQLTDTEKRISLLEDYGSSMRLKVNLADAYLENGEYLKSRETMDETYQSVKPWRRMLLCHKRALNELKIQKALNGWEWAALPPQEKAAFKKLLQQDNSAANELKTLAAAEEGKRYLVPVKMPEGIEEIYNEGEEGSISKKKAEEGRESQKAYFNLYPNPTEDALYLDTDSEQLIHAQVFMADGRLVLEKRITVDQALSLGGLSNGLLYILLLDGEGKLLHSGKIVKQ